MEKMLKFRDTERIQYVKFLINKWDFNVRQKLHIRALLMPYSFTLNSIEQDKSEVRLLIYLLIFRSLSLIPLLCH